MHMYMPLVVGMCACSYMSILIHANTHIHTHDFDLDSVKEELKNETPGGGGY